MVAGVNYDVSIGGNNFFLAIDDNNPHVRQTNDYKRQQIDTSPEPGEQTLSQWWVRSQDSWHRGAGILFYEPGTNHETEYRFADSQGINPWTQGSALPSWYFSRLTTAGSVAYCTGGIDTNGDRCFWYHTGGTGTLTRYDQDTTVSTIYTNSTGVALDTEPVIAGDKVLVGGTGTILVGTTTGNSLSSLWTQATPVSDIVPYWVKGRIIGVYNNNLYELTLAGGTLPAATFTPPIPNGTWTSIVEAPDCILAAYNAGGRGYVYAIRLNESTTSGSSPTLGAVVQVAEMPPGEQIYSMKIYLGSFVALGTTLGVRICDLGTGGQMTYGPLTIQTSQPVYALTFRDHYVYAGITGGTINGVTCNTGMARIDLGQEILNFTNTNFASKTLRYAWSFDKSIAGITSSKVTSIAHMGAKDTIAMAVPNFGIYIQQAGQWETGAYITSGKIRFGTVESKTFAYLKMRATVPSACSIEVHVIDSTGADTLITTVTSSTDLNQDISLGNIATTAQQYIQAKFILKTTDINVYPVIDAFQIMATPLPHIQRQIRYPLRLADFEQDRNGLSVGYNGAAWARLQALEALEGNQSLVTVVDNTNGETFTGIIQQIQFIRDTPPSRNNKNYGGRVNVTVLKV